MGVCAFCLASFLPVSAAESTGDGDTPPTNPAETRPLDRFGDATPAEADDTKPDDPADAGGAGSLGGPTASQAVAVLLERAGGLPVEEPVWEIGMALARQGGDESAHTLLKDAANAGSAGRRLAAGYALLRMGEQRDGARALLALLEDADAPTRRRIEAAEALGAEGGAYASSRVRRLLDKEEFPERVQVAVAKALWRLARSDTARKRLHELLDAESARARNEAAIALAAFVPMREAVALLETLKFQPGMDGGRARQTLIRRAREALVEGDFEEIAPHLRRIAEYPTALDLGAARTMLEVAQWEGVDREETRNEYAARLIAEIVGKVRRYYPPDLSGSEVERERELKRLTADRLAVQAAKTFVRGVDPFSAYLDQSDLEDMEQQIGGGYGGIGAWVGMRTFGGDPRFTILVPMYDQPAQQAGLRSMDWVERINGEEIGDLTLKEIITRLKGEPGTRVKLLVHRRSWRDPREVVVMRRRISVPSVRSRMLPGRIGYVRLERFGDHDSTPRELREQLEELRAAGMRGLILDLGNNPGGLLQTAVEVSDMFLEQNKLVVYSMGRPDTNLDMHKRRNYYSRTAPLVRLPMVVMINNGSASASEIVAGALRDHDRAVLVGRKTFGKGSIQSLIPVRASGPNTRLKLTVAKYYLPGGDCIHKKGIEPNVEVEPEELDDHRFRAVMDAREKMYVLYYIRDNYEDHSERFLELLHFDDEDLSAYPGADELLARIRDDGIDLHPQDLRREIRRELITYLESEKGRSVVVDAQEDRMLQRAVLELRKQMPEPGDPPPLYAWYERKLSDEKKKPEPVAPRDPAADPLEDE